MRLLLILPLIMMTACSRQPPASTTTPNTGTSSTTTTVTTGTSTTGTTTGTTTPTGTTDDDTLYDVQQKMAEGTAVYVENVVVVGATDYGFYIVEPAGGAWGGVYAYYGSAWQKVAGDLKVGDVINISGTVVEYNGTTEIDFYGGSVEYVGKGTLPAPVVVDTATMADEAAAEAYEAVLVTASGVVVTNTNPDDPSDFGEFAIDDGVRVDDLWYDIEGAVGGLSVGDTFDSISGLFRYEYSNFHITPLGAEDVVGYNGTTETGTTTTETGTTTTETGTPAPVAASISDVQTGVIAAGEVVEVEGVVTALTAYGLFIQTAAGGPYSGVFAYGGGGWDSAVSPVLGDLVTITGEVGEYYDLTQIDWVGGSLAVTTSGNTVTETPVTTTDLSNAKTAEQYESVLIQISNPTVTDLVVDESGVFAIDDGVLVDDLMYDVEADVGSLSVGASWTSVVGVLYYSWENFKVEPRDSADFGVFSPK